LINPISIKKDCVCAWVQRRIVVCSSINGQFVMEIQNKPRN